MCCSLLLNARSLSLSYVCATVLRNPHYPPEVCVMVNLLNFMATPAGLQDQMLGEVVRQELPQLQIDKERLVTEEASNKAKLADIEDTILRLLKESTGSIVDDVDLIRTLQEGNVVAQKIQKQMIVAGEFFFHSIV